MFFSLSVWQGYPSDAVSLDLPSDAARALPVEHPCFLSLSGEAYPSDAVSLDLLSDAARALPVEHLCFLSLHLAWLPVRYSES